MGNGEGMGPCGYCEFIKPLEQVPATEKWLFNTRSEVGADMIYSKALCQDCVNELKKVPFLCKSCLRSGMVTFISDGLGGNGDLEALLCGLCLAQNGIE